MDWASFFICFTGWTLGGIVNGISGLGAGIFALPIVLLVTDIKTGSLITCIILSLIHISEPTRPY